MHCLALITALLLPVVIDSTFIAETAQATITIGSCYDGDTPTSMAGEKIRLACINSSELNGSHVDPLPALAALDFLNDLVAGEEVLIRCITKDRFVRTVAKLSKDEINIQQLLVKKALLRSMQSKQRNVAGVSADLFAI